MTEMFELIQNFGLPTVMLVYFVLMNHQRDRRDEKARDRLNERMTKSEDYQKEKLEALVIKATDTIVNNNIAFNNTTTALRDLTAELHRRP